MQGELVHIFGRKKVIVKINRKPHLNKRGLVGWQSFKELQT